MKKNVVFRSIVCSLTCLSAYAFAESTTLRIPNQMTFSRPASLGGAFTAVADDQNALFFNPAGLALIDETFMAIGDIEASASLGTGGIGALIDDVSKAVDLAKGVQSAKSDSAKIDSAVDFGKLLSSRTVYANASWGLYLARNRWGLALTARTGAGAGIHSNVLPELADAGLYADFDLRGAYAHPFLDGRVSLGIAPYLRTRAQAGAANLTISDVVDDGSTFKDPKVGNGLGLDFGLMVRPFKTMSPTFGLAVVNVGDTHLKVSEDSFLAQAAAFEGKKIASPEALKQVVNAGFSITPIDGRGFVRVSGELREINRPTPAELKPAGAVEAGFRSSIVRATAALGWGNGGWSAGFEARAFLKLRLATYIEPDLLFARKENQRVWVFSVGI
jgi:hypothetical protein